jgi:hypothetical protein
VHTERPRARRYSFVATIELTDTQSEAKIQERTSELSLSAAVSRHTNHSRQEQG